MTTYTLITFTRWFNLVLSIFLQVSLHKMSWLHKTSWTHCYLQTYKQCLIFNLHDTRMILNSQVYDLNYKIRSFLLNIYIKVIWNLKSTVIIITKYSKLWRIYSKLLEHRYTNLIYYNNIYTNNAIILIKEVEKSSEKSNEKKFYKCRCGYY